MEMFDTRTGKKVADVKTHNEKLDTEEGREFVEWLMGILFGKNRVAIDRSKKGDFNE
jgi:hypothetical protein